jgi:hypothetical protein
MVMSVLLEEVPVIQGLEAGQRRLNIAAELVGGTVRAATEVYPA